MKKRNIGFLVFMLVIGFAAVSSALVINGNFNISFNESDFTSNVVFTKAETLDGTATIDTNNQNIVFETKKLENIGDTAVLSYEVTNKSRQYNANITITCGFKDSFTSFNKYFDITNDITNPFELVPAESKSGKLIIKLKNAWPNDTTIEFQCTLTANPVSRDTVGEKYVVPYKDLTLNGTDPVLDKDKNIIPVTIANDGEVTYADIESEWYNYEAKKWANAVILVDSPSKEYDVNDIIDEHDIESYFVWIPRYRYQIFDEGNYTSIINSSLPAISNAKEIQIEFESKEKAASKGNTKGSWLTHPAFTNYNTNGIWVGKFETGYKGATSASNAQQNVTDATKVIIKPKVFSWRGINASNIFKTSLAYAENLTSHMMRNTEWGAAAYLSHSRYGINYEVRINNNSNFLTGYAANTKDANGSATETSAYNTEIGYLASTTGNITGIYDMNGGAWEHVAGVRANTPGKSGFTTVELTTYASHIDIYNISSGPATYNYRILGDATGEMGPFYQKGAHYYNNWYDDFSIFADSERPWFARGASYYDGNGSNSGQFNFGRSLGGVDNSGSFRITLTPKT